MHESVKDYAKSVNKKIFDAGFESEFDEESSDTLNKRIRNAQLDQFNFILVIGPREKENGTVNVRTRDNAVCVISVYYKMYKKQNLGDFFMFFRPEIFFLQK